LLKPFVECTKFYGVLDRRIPCQHSDRKVLADVLNPTALPDRPEPERNRFIEAFSRHLGTMLDSLGIADGNAA
jgi:hypothetical protein